MKAKIDKLEKTLERFNVGSKGLGMVLGSQRPNNDRSGLGYRSSPSKANESSYARVANDHGKGEVSKAKGKSYARVAYDYSKEKSINGKGKTFKGKEKLTKDKVSKVKKVRFVGQVSPGVDRCGLAIVDESPREVTKVKSSRGSSKSQFGTHGQWISGGFYLGV